MKKRGVSKIIATVLLILLAIVLIIIVWNLIRLFLNDETRSIGIRNRLIDEDLDIRSIDTDGSTLDLTLSKGAGKSVLLGNETKEVNYTMMNVTFQTTLVNYTIVVLVNYTVNTTENVTIIVPINITRNVTINVTYTEIVNTTISPDVDIVSVVDLSGSMMGAKIADAKSATKSFIDAVLEINDILGYVSNRIGLVGYKATVADSDCSPLSSNQASLENIVENNWAALGSTCVCCGVEKATQYLASSTNYKAMVVMSDGLANAYSGCSGSGNAQQRAIQAAQRAYTNYGIKVHTIGFGSDVDASTLQSMATAGHGDYHFADIGELGVIYSELNITYSNITITIPTNITITEEVNITTTEERNITVVVWENRTEIIWENQTIVVQEEYINTTTITIQQYGSELAYDFLLITLQNNTDSYNHKLPADDVPSPHETTTISIPLLNPSTGSPYITGINKIEIRAIVIDEDGEEIIGPVLDTWYGG